MTTDRSKASETCGRFATSSWRAYDLEVVDIYQQPVLAKGEQIIAAPGRSSRSFRYPCGGSSATCPTGNARLDSIYLVSGGGVFGNDR
jgi:hypothetical protein